MTFAESLKDLNLWYDRLPDDRRVFVYPGVLLAAALVSAKWTGTPFGWVFFAAVAALVVLRRVYAPAQSEALAGGPAENAAPPRAFVAQLASVQPAATAPQPPAAPPEAAEPAASPAPQPTSQPAPVAPSVAAQPAAKPAPQSTIQSAPAVPPHPGGMPASRSASPSVKSAPTVDGPAPRPAPAGGQKKTNAPPRKNDGRSGRRKPGDKHP